MILRIKGNFYIYFVLTLLIILGCSNANKKRVNNLTKDETSIFSEYLKKIHNFELTSGRQRFVVIPKRGGCSGCKRISWELFNEGLVNHNDILICSTDFLDEMKPSMKNRLLIDSSGCIERLNIPTREVAIILTDKKKVISITNLNPSNVVPMLLK